MDRNYIISEFKRVSRELGKNSMPKKEFFLNSNVSEWHIMKLFGSYNEAVIASGLNPIPKTMRPSQESVFEEMLRVFQEYGGICSAFEFGRRSKFSRDLPTRIFGSWKKALLSFAIWIQSTGKHFEALPDLLKQEDNSTLAITKEIEHIQRDNAQVQQIAYESIGGSRYGTFINFRGLQHAPINEQGVVFLFGMICFELGFIVEAIRAEYPDCEAKRRIDKRKDLWERVRIEFEYRSGNFREHSHRAKDCDLIVCWEHNWVDCPIEVLELKNIITNLEK